MKDLAISPPPAAPVYFPFFYLARNIVTSAETFQLIKYSVDFPNRYVIMDLSNVKTYEMEITMEAIHLKIGEKLKTLRTAHALTLDDVSSLTGVSKPMLGQIERGQSVPTVTTLWKIATGLKAPLSYFLEMPQAEYRIVAPEPSTVVQGDGGKMRAYPLFTYDPVRSVETFYIVFAPGCRHFSDKHSDGVEEHIFVLQGALRLVLGDKTVDVSEKQAVRFRADISHAYQNLSQRECAVYNTIFYPNH